MPKYTFLSQVGSPSVVLKRVSIVDCEELTGGYSNVGAETERVIVAEGEGARLDGITSAGIMSIRSALMRGVPQLLPTTLVVYHRLFTTGIRRPRPSTKRPSSGSSSIRTKSWLLSHLERAPLRSITYARVPVGSDLGPNVFSGGTSSTSAYMTREDLVQGTPGRPQMYNLRRTIKRISYEDSPRCNKQTIAEWFAALTLVLTFTGISTTPFILFRNSV